MLVPDAVQYVFRITRLLDGVPMPESFTNPKHEDSRMGGPNHSGVNEVQFRERCITDGEAAWKYTSGLLGRLEERLGHSGEPGVAPQIDEALPQTAWSAVQCLSAFVINREKAQGIDVVEVTARRLQRNRDRFGVSAKVRRRSFGS